MPVAANHVFSSKVCFQLLLRGWLSALKSCWQPLLTCLRKGKFSVYLVLLWQTVIVRIKGMAERFLVGGKASPYSTRDPLLSPPTCLTFQPYTRSSPSPFISTCSHSGGREGTVTERSDDALLLALKTTEERAMS